MLFSANCNTNSPIRYVSEFNASSTAGRSYLLDKGAAKWSRFSGTRRAKKLHGCRNYARQKMDDLSNYVVARDRDCQFSPYGTERLERLGIPNVLRWPLRLFNTTMSYRLSHASLIAFAFLSMTGCVQYVARPVSPNAIATAQTEHRFDPSSLVARYALLAPSQHFDPERWDQLALFVAMLEYNPDIASARAGMLRAIAEERAASAPVGPTLTLSTEYAGATTESSPWLVGAALDVPLDIGGRRAARLDTAGLKTAIARYDYLEAIWTARQALRAALVNRIISFRQSNVGLQLVALRERHFAAVARRVTAGETTRADLERIRADLSEARRRATDASTRVIAETRTIAHLTGVPVSDLSGAKIIWEEFDAPISFEPDPRSRRAALVARADILRIMSAYEQSEAELRGEVARQYPAISVGPGFTWERGLIKLPFSLGLVLPPLDLNRRAIAAAEAKRAEAGRLLEAAVTNATAAIDAAEIEAHAAREALAAIRLNELPAAVRLAAQADREIRVGAIDRTDWAASQSGSLVARLAELDALARVHAADTMVELALRRPLAGPELNIVGTLGALQ